MADPMTFDRIRKALEDCMAHQARSVMDWHFGEPVYDDPDEAPELEGISGLRELSARLHWVNFRMWHLEDRARRRDLDTSVIAECKYAYDRLNQVRNALTERLDECLWSLMEPLLPKQAGPNMATETVGCVLGRLSVEALRIYHLKEQARRRDVDHDHVNVCTGMCADVEAQREAVGRAVLGLIDQYEAGTLRPAVHRFFKMYNDPDLNPELYKNKQE